MQQTLAGLREKLTVKVIVEYFNTLLAIMDSTSREKSNEAINDLTP